MSSPEDSRLSRNRAQRNAAAEPFGSNDDAAASCALGTRFANLREEDANAAPPFDRTVAAAAALPRRRSVWRLALVATAVLVIAVTLAVRTPHPTDTIPQELTAWSSPTAFLLETPGRQLLNQTPRLGELPIRALPSTEDRPQ